MRIWVCAPIMCKWARILGFQGNGNVEEKMTQSEVCSKSLLSGLQVWQHRISCSCGFCEMPQLETDSKEKSVSCLFVGTSCLSLFRSWDTGLQAENGGKRESEGWAEIADRGEYPGQPGDARHRGRQKLAEDSLGPFCPLLSPLPSLPLPSPLPSTHLYWFW